MSVTSALGKAADSASNLSDFRAPTNRNAAGEMTIGEMAREYGVTLRTLRFYEDRNLIHPRRAGNARYYGGPDRVRLEMILKGKRLGFTLAEISELIGGEDGAARPTSRAGCSPLRSSINLTISSVSGARSRRRSPASRRLANACTAWPARLRLGCRMIASDWIGV